MSARRDDAPMRLLDLLLPAACASCGTAGRLMCDACGSRLRPPWDPRDRFVTPDAGVVLGDALVLGTAAFAHEGPARRALASLKYRGTSRLASVLAEAAMPALRRLLEITGPATLVPVPVHAERRRERGYDQAELLAIELARRAGLPMRRGLIRVRATTKQHRLNRTARLANLRHAFDAIGPATGVVLLVDDIVTTSATLEACAAVLRAAGAREVYGFAIAREV